MGKIAVGWVVKNRVNDPRWPNTYSGVINQPNQFAIFRDDPSKLTGLNKIAWDESYRIAGQVIRGEIPDPTGGATHFYSTKKYGNKPKIVVDYPNGGEIWAIGSTQTIGWHWENWPSSWGDTTKFEFRVLIGNHRFYYELPRPRGVKIELSRDEGRTWTTIIPNTANDGSEPWRVTGSPTTRALIRVTNIADPAISDTSDRLFTIRDVTPPSVRVISPNGGEVWKVGETRNIIWTATDNVGVTRINIFYSTDGGKTWRTIATGLSNTGSYNWRIPNTPPTNCLVRIDAYDAAGNKGSDASDRLFTIRKS
jgi:hypothetical protein